VSRRRNDRRLTHSFLSKKASEVREDQLVYCYPHVRRGKNSEVSRETRTYEIGSTKASFYFIKGRAESGSRSHRKGVERIACARSNRSLFNSTLTHHQTGTCTRKVGGRNSLSRTNNIPDRVSPLGTRNTRARLYRTTTPLGVPRFEALTHHQAGSCTQNAIAEASFSK
jgi:hypothetical protein